MPLLRFQPIYQERVWGGRRLANLFGRALPPDVPIGESWDVVDRPEAQSLVQGGPDHGTPLHDLWTQRRAAVFGTAAPATPRFPILVKLLDASDILSLQVHPPAAVAAALGGEPKTEMWYLLDCQPGAQIFAGLRRGVTRDSFMAALDQGKLSDLFHRISTQPGDCMFVPSGRVHAIGGGNVICEIQQNSDTTYRVYDWGRPRPLHIAESVRSIDFDDIEPELQPRGQNPLVQCPHFTTLCDTFDRPQDWRHNGTTFTLFFVVEGSVTLQGETLNRGQFALATADSGHFEVAPAQEPCTVLWVQW